jgi:hypothetical protein
MNTGKIVELLQSILRLKKTFLGITNYMNVGKGDLTESEFQLFSNQLSIHCSNPIIKQPISTRKEFLAIYKNRAACIREEELMAQNYIYEAIAKKCGQTPIGERVNFEYPERRWDEYTGTKYELFVYEETGERRIRVRIKDYTLDDDASNMQTPNPVEFTI